MIKMLVHSVSGSFYERILELKNEMVNLELLEFHYFDDILTDMKLTPVRIFILCYTMPRHTCITARC